ncbi:copper resistance protein B [Alloalcanivorax xenomutans]|uniref:copper resistance protein B n=1 Tax=Alloalcanivorax xenomutans TaxID=1094342 RepID=UPI000BDD5397|nr:copper resistance protein B [Alloalcanivorax xenomutans]SOB95492.1 copper resistance protein B [Alloalcanivorax xenomutans]
MKSLTITNGALTALLALFALFTTTSAQAMEGVPARFGQILVDQLEARDADDGTVAAWSANAWYGGDINKLYFATEGERLMDRGGETESLETRLAWSRAFAPYWDWQLGVRRDWQPDDPNRDWVSVGVMGVAPYFFETEANLFLGESGHSELRLEAEYELLFTQRLILTPEVEASLYGKEDRDLGIGKGLATVEAGLRLRYEIRREFAPYIGVHWERKFGDTADFARDHGEDASDTLLVAGIRVWY